MRHILLIGLFIFFSASLVMAQSVPVPAPKPMLAMKAMAPAAMKAPKSVVPVLKPVMAAKKVAPGAAAMKAPKPASTKKVTKAAMVAVPKAAVLTPTTPAAPEKPAWKSPAFWIGVVGGPLAGMIIAILVAFGVIKKSWFAGDRWQNIQKVADKAISSFRDYASSTAAPWDDVVALILSVVAARLGDLTKDEEDAVKGLIETRRHELDLEEDDEDEEDDA